MLLIPIHSLLDLIQENKESNQHFLFSHFYWDSIALLLLCIESLSYNSYGFSCYFFNFKMCWKLKFLHNNQNPLYFWIFKNFILPLISYTSQTFTFLPYHLIFALFFSPFFILLIFFFILIWIYFHLYIQH